MQDNSSLEYHLTEHFRLSGIYWGMTALYLVDKMDMVDGNAIVQWVGFAYTYVGCHCIPRHGVLC